MSTITNAIHGVLRSKAHKLTWRWPQVFYVLNSKLHSAALIGNIDFDSCLVQVVSCWIQYYWFEIQLTPIPHVISFPSLVDKWNFDMAIIWNTALHSQDHSLCDQPHGSSDDRAWTVGDNNCAQNSTFVSCLSCSPHALLDLESFALVNSSVKQLSARSLLAPIRNIQLFAPLMDRSCHCILSCTSAPWRIDISHSS